jgi:hypothetical protein
MNKTILFFYGTLKTGGQSNHLLAGAECLGPARTLPLYRLYGLGWHPGAVLDRAKCAMEAPADRLEQRKTDRQNPGEAVRFLRELSSLRNASLTKRRENTPIARAIRVLVARR